MKADGSDVQRLTNRPGPDGGPFFSWDGKLIAFRGRPLPPGPELDDYRALLKEGLWRPTSLELFVMDRDGEQSAPGHEAGRRQLRAVVASGRQAADLRVEHPRSEGAQLRRCISSTSMAPASSGSRSTRRSTAFPMFSPDGKHLVFASNRNAKVEGETNVFIADWVE